MRQHRVTRNQSVSSLFSSELVLRRILATTLLLVLCLIANGIAYATPTKVSPATKIGWFNDYSVQSSSIQTTKVEVGLAARQADQIYTKASALYQQGELLLAKRLLVPRALEGHKDAQFLLAVIYDSTLDNSEPTNQAWRSFFWYLAAARQGHSDAQHNLALAYARGEGVDIDLASALLWWQRAAQQGNADSQYNLGVMYAVGAHGVDQDLRRAKMWWLRAAKHGDPVAQYNLGALYAMESVPFHNNCAAFRWLIESRRNGFERAMVALQSLDSKGVTASVCRR